MLEEPMIDKPIPEDADKVKELEKFQRGLSPTIKRSELSKNFSKAFFENLKFPIYTSWRQWKTLEIRVGEK